MTKTTTKPCKFVKPAYVDAPLSVLYSCRVRLEEDERKVLKEAYAAKAKQQTPQALPSIGGSSLSVQTQHSTPNLDEELSMSRLIFNDLVSSRDSINLSILIKIQTVLGVEVIKRDKLQAAFDNYLDYCFSQFLED